jgi:hypothetical protein
MRHSLARNRQYRGYRSHAYRAADAIAIAKDELDILEGSLYNLEIILQGSVVQDKITGTAELYTAIKPVEQAVQTATDDNVAEKYQNLRQQLVDVYNATISLGDFFTSFKVLEYKNIGRLIKDARSSIRELEDYREEGIV